MNFSIFKLAAALLGLLALAACATSPAPAAMSATGASALLGPVLTCPNAAGQLCKIPVQISTFVGPSGQTLCTASLTSQVTFSGTDSTAKNRFIFWVLSPNTIGPNLSYAFQSNNGILVTSDTYNQLYDFGLGDGAGVYPWVYHTFNRQNAKGSEASYLPIILQTDTSTNPPMVSLCAVADPKIVNN